MLVFNDPNGGLMASPTESYVISPQLKLVGKSAFNISRYGGSIYIKDSRLTWTGAKCFHSILACHRKQ